MASVVIQNETGRFSAADWHRVFLAWVFIAISFFHLSTSANETSTNETSANTDAAKDWRYDKPYVEHWTRSWECFRERKYECAKRELAPLLDMDLTPEQDSQTRRTMVMSVVNLSNAAFWNEDYNTQIRHLEEAVELDPRELEVARRKHLIAQAYKLLEQWSDCARYGEEVITTVIEYGYDLAHSFAAVLAECHQKSNNVEKARHWVAVSKRLAQEKEEGWDSAGWEQQISRIEEALSNPGVQE